MAPTYSMKDHGALMFHLSSLFVHAEASLQCATEDLRGVACQYREPLDLPYFPIRMKWSWRVG